MKRFIDEMTNFELVILCMLIIPALMFGFNISYLPILKNPKWWQNDTTYIIAMLFCTIVSGMSFGLLLIRLLKNK